mmetsp:Transcript_159455/g.487938  ORF Transcript_159455/g.487938 Transcript_159455/m.487938 type:complete len:217 (-) Transcript_159455:115-765(-)
MVEKSHGTCLLCVPLRTGIVFIAAGTIAYSFLGLLVLATGDLRFQPGGYSTHTARLQAAVASAGLVFGLMGLLGLYDGKPEWVRRMARFLEAKLAVSILVFVFDVVALMRCPSWASVPGSQTANMPLYMISSKGLCSTARLCYGIGFAIDFTANYYFAWVTRIYCSRLSASQSYPINFKDTLENHSHMMPYDPVHGSPAQHLEGAAGADYGTSAAA